MCDPKFSTVELALNERVMSLFWLLVQLTHWQY